MKKKKANILLVEDDKNLGFILKDFLEMSGYFVELLENGEDGINAFKKNIFDLCILDVMLPVRDGFSVAKDIRKRDKKIPIIFLTAKTLDEDKIKGFKLGGDDYITKPFSTELLILRIEAILRRSKYASSADEEKNMFSVGKFTFDFSSHLLTSADSERKLTKKEAEVLRLLCLNMNNVVRREIVLKSIWGEDDYFMGRSMDVYITRLRKFFKDDPLISITNEHSVGFMLKILTDKKK